MEPPGRFSMISGWPHFWRSSSPSARMKMSLKPPALVVVMALTGRVGQSSAAAGSTAAVKAIIATSSGVENFMIYLSIESCRARWASFHVWIKSRRLDDLARFDALGIELLGELLGTVQHGR